MLWSKLFAIAIFVAPTPFLISCGSHDTGADNSSFLPKHDEEKVLNVFWWSDFMAPHTLSNFEKQTGIKVNISYYESEEILETRILAGNSGFDVVDPAAPYFFQRQLRSRAYLAIDKSRLSNLHNLDPAIMSQVAHVDPDNAHGIVYMWGTIGIGYNRAKVAKASPNTAMDSWAAIFDPVSASKLSKCGIQILDSPAEIVTLVLRYLGKRADSSSSEDLEAVSHVLMAIRPSIQKIDTQGYQEAIVNGDVCVVVGYNGDFVQARRRAQEARSSVEIAYSLPKEGSVVYFNMVAIPRDAPHAANAHLFMNYLMNPNVIADITNFAGYANANSAATSLLEPSITSDPIAYPTLAERSNLYIRGEDSPEQTRAITRLWQKFKTGQ